MRLLAALAFVLTAAFGNALLAADASELEVGDRVDIFLTGDLATEFAQSPEDRIRIERGMPFMKSGLVVDKPAADKVTVRYRCIFERPSEKDRMVTLTATVDQSQVRAFISSGMIKTIHRGNATLRSTVSEHTTYSVQLSKLSEVKLESYELAR